MAAPYGAYRSLTTLASGIDALGGNHWQALMGLSIAALIGAIVLAVAVVPVVNYPGEIPRKSLWAYLVTFVWFLAGAATLAVGDGELIGAFGDLATSEHLDMDVFLSEVRAGIWWLITGGILLCAGCIAACWGSHWTLLADPKPRRTLPGTGFFGVMGVAILGLSAAWHLSGTYGLQVFFEQTQNVKPDVLASHLTTILLSVMGFAGGYTALAIAFLLTALPSGQGK